MCSLGFKFGPVFLIDLPQNILDKLLGGGNQGLLEANLNN